MIARTAAFIGIALVAIAPASTASHALADYRYFRALSIDLQGRPPTPEELEAFERPDFDTAAWIDTHLAGPGYAERMRRVYMDVLRLEVGPSFQFVPNPLVLRRQEILGPDGVSQYVYFRRGQRRVDAAIDGDICFSKDEAGVQFPTNAAPIGTPKPISQALLDERTRLVKPWWLYADYRATTPTDHVASDWPKRFPGFEPVKGLLLEPDGKTPTTAVRVCKEEAQTADNGTVYMSGRPALKKGEPNPYDRLTAMPGDSGFARSQHGRAVSCLSGTGFQNSVECGCGIGLERCMPGAGFVNDPPAFVMPTHTPLGQDMPFERTEQPGSAWARMWWGEEASHFIEKLFLEDRDIREMLTSRGTAVNGPLAQFYRSMASATCCGPAADLGYSQPQPLVEPGAVPDALTPEDTATWLPIGDRGPRASGILTMPIFLTKYGSRRARAHVLYQAFLCKDFVADSVKLAPSTEADLTKRPGCSTCHQTLEPMAAYFTRIEESGWTWLPATEFPMSLQRCTGADPTKVPGACKIAYDPAFTDAHHTTLRGAYAAPSHAEAGPTGMAADITSAPEFASCVVQNVAQSLLGRSLAPEDDAWKTQLAKTLVDGGFRMKPLVRAIVTSPRYRDGNDTASRLLR